MEFHDALIFTHAVEQALHNIPAGIREGRGFTPGGFVLAQQSPAGERFSKASLVSFEIPEGLLGPETVRQIAIQTDALAAFLADFAIGTAEHIQGWDAPKFSKGLPAGAFSALLCVAQLSASREPAAWVAGLSKEGQILGDLVRVRSEIILTSGAWPLLPAGLGELN